MKTAHVAGNFRAGNFVGMACTSGTADVSQVGAAVRYLLGSSIAHWRLMIWSGQLVWWSGTSPATEISRESVADTPIELYLTYQIPPALRYPSSFTFTHRRAT